METAIQETADSILCPSWSGHWTRRHPSQTWVLLLQQNKPGCRLVQQTLMLSQMIPDTMVKPVVPPPGTHFYPTAMTDECCRL